MEIVLYCIEKKKDPGDSLENPWLFESPNSYSTRASLILLYLHFTDITIKPANVRVNKVIVIMIILLLLLLLLLFLLLFLLFQLMY